eukprot:2555257-Lingulodinium_polyedra.AAC.1
MKQQQQQQWASGSRQQAAGSRQQAATAPAAAAAAAAAARPGAGARLLQLAPQGLQAATERGEQVGGALGRGRGLHTTLFPAQRRGSPGPHPSLPARTAARAQRAACS